jgi:hypothetical protein
VESRNEKGHVEGQCNYTRLSAWHGSRPIGNPITFVEDDTYPLANPFKASPQAIVEFVGERMGPTAGEVIRTMLAETRGQEQSVAEKSSGGYTHSLQNAAPCSLALESSARVFWQT